MKVLHINSYLVDRFFYDGLYKEQLRDGIEIDVYVSVPRGGSHEAKKLGEYVHVKEDHDNWNKFLYFPKQNKIIASVDRSLDVASYDILHAHSWYTNGYVAMKLADRYKKPYIVAIRNGDVNNFYRKVPFLRGIGHRILSKATKVIFLSETYRKMVVDGLLPANIRDAIRDKCVVIPNGIDEFWFNNKYREKRELPAKRIRAIYAGEVTQNKNIQASIDALEILKRKGYETSLTVIGAVKDDTVFVKINESPIVTYKSKMPKEQLIKEYRAHDIFMMPSLTEAFGLVYAEAISQGLPVIYTKGQGFYGQFPDGQVGFSVDCNSPEDIAAKVLDIIGNYTEISKNCVVDVEKFTWNRIAQVYSEIYRSV